MLARISEAAIKLGPQAESLLPDIDWRGIRNLGNVLRHDYDNVLPVLVWEIVDNQLRPLLADVEGILARYPADQEKL